MWYNNKISPESIVMETNADFFLCCSHDLVSFGLYAVCLMLHQLAFERVVYFHFPFVRLSFVQKICILGQGFLLLMCYCFEHRSSTHRDRERERDREIWNRILCAGLLYAYRYSFKVTK